MGNAESLPLPLNEGDATRAQALLVLGRLLRGRGYRFTTVSPATHARVNGRAGNAWAEDLAGVFGWSRPFADDLLPASLMALLRAADAVEPCAGGWRSRVRFSTLPGEGRADLCLHSAYPTSAEDAIFFGPDTYRYCGALRAFLASGSTQVRHAIDIGCGSGAGAITMARLRPEAAVLASDINDGALRTTRINAALAGVPLEVRHSDLLRQVDGLFDLIAANPPYLVDSQRRAYRHGGGDLGAELSLAIVRAALPRLTPGGTLLLYTGVAMVRGDDPFLREVVPMLAAAQADWHYRELDPDIFGEELDSAPYRDADRIAAVLLTVSRSG